MTTKEKNEKILKMWNDNITHSDREAMFCVFMSHEGKITMAANQMFQDRKMMKTLLIEILTELDSATPILISIR